MEFEKYLEIREENILGVDKWYWHKEDTGVWHVREEFRDIQFPFFMQHLDRKKVIVQAGGALGMYPRIYSEHFEMVYTFEPDYLNFYFLNLNCQRRNIVKLNAAVGDHHHLISMNADETNTNRGVFTVNEDTAKSRVVPVLEIDDLNLPCCDFIHLDIEGYEKFAIKGASATIRQFKPLIALERFSPEQAEESILGELGYSHIGVVGSDHVYKYIP